MRELSPADAAARLETGTLTVVDVRPAAERAQAALPVAVMTLDDGGAAVAALDRATPLAFLCHHGNRSATAAAQFRAQGFTEVYNITGGIDAWAEHVDLSVPRY